ncbi:MAG TPA: Rossmann-like and DUF2520 domain-containing protein [Planctomycetota bacterium]|nr:Rossmann-like and DUF2520 domain-containing protein [Planctomycetota bacterium]
MSLRIVIVGPGRVGSALGRGLAQRGASVLGFVGRDPAHSAAAVRFCGAGSVLQWHDLPRAHVVLFAVGDGDLRAAVAHAVDVVPARQCSLWMHTSGRHDLSVFDAALPAGIRRGSLHPVAPFADAAAGLRAIAGAPAVLDGDPRSLRLLRRLCTWLGMVPIVGGGGDRVLYHAACALAANGLTALHGAAARAFAAAGVGPADAHATLVEALMAAALRSASQRGAAAALSGPVRRGDVPTVLAHLEALARAAPELLDTYRALMGQAIELAAHAGLAAESVSRLRRVLSREPGLPG